MADGQELEKRIKVLEEREGIDVNERIKTCKAISESNSKWYRHQGIVTMSILTLFIAAFSVFVYVVVYLGGKNYIKGKVATSVEKSVEGKVQPLIDEYKKDLDVRIATMENRIEVNYWYKVGEKEFENKDYSSAVKSFTKVLEKAPNHVYAVGVRGIAYTRLGMMKEAIVDLDKAIDIKDDYAIAYGYKGAAHFHLKEYVAAFNAFHKEIDLYIKRGNYKVASETISAVSSEFDKVKVDEKFDDGMRKSVEGVIAQLQKQLEEAKKESQNEN